MSEPGKSTGDQNFGPHVKSWVLGDAASAARMRRITTICFGIGGALVILTLVLAGMGKTAGWLWSAIFALCFLVVGLIMLFRWMRERSAGRETVNLFERGLRVGSTAKPTRVFSFPTTVMTENHTKHSNGAASYTFELADGAWVWKVKSSIRSRDAVLAIGDQVVAAQINYVEELLRSGKTFNFGAITVDDGGITGGWRSKYIPFDGLSKVALHNGSLILISDTVKDFNAEWSKLENPRTLVALIAARTGLAPRS